MKRRKDLTDATDEELHGDLIEARRLIEAEIELLRQTFPDKLVQYVAITAAIKLGVVMDQSPADFCSTVARVVGLYCGDKPGEASSVHVIEFPGGE